MTDTMIERVARAIAAADRNMHQIAVQGVWVLKFGDGRPPFIGTEVQCRDARRRELARAAIAAMREPDDKMQQAMALDPDQWAETHQTDVWRAMIDAALKEGQE